MVRGEPFLSERVTMRLEIFDCDQLFFPTLRETFGKIDNHRATQINFERRFLDRFAGRIEMKLRVSVRAIVHAHGNCAKIHALAVRYLFC